MGMISNNLEEMLANNSISFRVEAREKQSGCGATPKNPPTLFLGLCKSGREIMFGGKF